MGRILQGSFFSKTKSYECQHEWPEDCFTQFGDRGIVFTESNMEQDLKNPEELLKEVIKPTKPHYTTAFFEAFPTDPKTFIRGEGPTVQEAETKAWNKLQKHKACPAHEFERGKYRNGAGTCKHCKLFASDIFEPSTKCIICDTPSYYSSDKKDNWYCEKHIEQNPDRIKYDGLD